MLHQAIAADRNDKLRALRPHHTPPLPLAVSHSEFVRKAQIGRVVTWYDMPLLAWFDCNDGQARLAVAVPETSTTKGHLPYYVVDVTRESWEAWKDGAAGSDLRDLFKHTPQAYTALWHVQDSRFHLTPVAAPVEDWLPSAGLSFLSACTENGPVEPALPLAGEAV